MRLWATLALFVVGCATASRKEQHVSEDAGTRPPADSAPLAQDAAPTPVDAPSGCTTTTVDILMNGNFDSATLGQGWTETPINPVTYPIISSDDGASVQSAPNDAWMGGIVSGQDDLYQDIAIPASTTALRLTGYLDIRTSESTLFPLPYDTATVVLETPGGTTIDTILSLDNTQATGGWTPIDHMFTANVAGQTVRLDFKSSNDSSNPTSFLYDTLALQATYCQ